MYFIGMILGAPAFTFVALWATKPGPDEDDSGGPVGLLIVFVILPIIGAALGLAVSFMIHMTVLITRRIRGR